MPLSIFNSDSHRNDNPNALRRACLAFVFAVTLFFGVLEVATRSFIFTLSDNLGRINNEAEAANRVSGSIGDLRQALLVGNSLLLNAVDVDALNTSMTTKWVTQRFAIEQTAYFDWHFGIKRLLSSAAKPGAVVMFLDTNQFLSSFVLTDIFSYYLMDHDDIFDVHKQLTLTLSDSSELLLDNWSVFLAMRREIRKNMLGRILPDLAPLTAMSANEPPAALTITMVESLGHDRIRALRKIERTFGVKLVLVLVPPSQGTFAKNLKEYGAQVGIDVVTPIDVMVVKDSDYGPDRYHFGAAGRARYSRALGPILSRALSTER